MTVKRICPEPGCHRHIRGNILYRHLERTHGKKREEARRLAAEAKEVPPGKTDIADALNDLTRALKRRKLL